MSNPTDSALFNQLAMFDTPTVCNAIEVIGGARRDTGFTCQTMIPSQQNIVPFVGRAKTAKLSSVKREGVGDMAKRMKYYRYVSEQHAVVVIEDIDQPAGLGAFWGEVNSAVHAALGLIGVVTNGSMRDLEGIDKRLPILAGAITPSHAFVEIEEQDVPVEVLGMKVEPNAIVHADRHGAVVIPDDMASKLADAAAQLQKREKDILDVAAASTMSMDLLEATFARMRATELGEEKA